LLTLVDKRLQFGYFALQSLSSMNDLKKALGDISSIRREMARSTQFRGYGPTTLATTGAFAFLAAAAQAIWLPDPAKHMQSYLGIWASTALLYAV
jgi:hypothetical protein